MSLKIKLIKEQYYIILPMVCFFLWALLSLIKDNFILVAADYPSFYDAGKYIFTEPELVYTTFTSSRFRYLPSFATIFSIMALFPYHISQWIFFFILLFLGEFSIKLFNDILKLKNVNHKPTRFLFLLVLSNGLIITRTFDFLQTKLIVIYLFLLFLKREIKFRKSEEENINILKFKFIQFMILVFAISMVPYLAFLILIYLFDNIKIKELFSKSQLYNYFLLIMVFVIQNFMFIVSPILILGFLQYGLRGFYPPPINLTVSAIKLDENPLPNNTLSSLISAFNLNIDNSILILISFGLMIIVTLFLIINRKMSITQKFGYFMLISLFINIYPRPNALIALLSLILLLFIVDIKFEKNIFDYIKQNYLFLFGLISISVLYFMPPLFYLYRVLPFLEIIPLPLMILRNTFVYTIIISDLYLINRKKNLNKN
ncbi:MAG: hypothetical protein ACFE8C_02320 [Promethearchaeota archaeon]